MRNKHWWHIVEKHGFQVQIYKDNLCEQDAFDLEALLITQLRETCLLANVTDGGGGVAGSHVNLGVAKSESHKQKLRQANLGKTGRVPIQIKLQ